MLVLGSAGTVGWHWESFRRCERFLSIALMRQVFKRNPLNGSKTRPQHAGCAWQADVQSSKGAGRDLFHLAGAAGTRAPQVQESPGPPAVSRCTIFRGRVPASANNPSQSARLDPFP